MHLASVRLTLGLRTAQAECPQHGEKRFDRLTKVALYLREHCRCRRAPARP